MPAASEKMRYWVDVALECVRRDHTPEHSKGDQKGPFLTARALGMALAALHDAYILNGTRLLTLPATIGSPPPAMKLEDQLSAGAAACHQLLVLRYPDQAATLNADWDHWVDLYKPAATTPFELYGRNLANAIHLLGVNDRHYANMNRYTPTGPYAHDVPPHEPTQGFAGSAWGDVSPLLAAKVDNFAMPPGRTSPVSVVANAHFEADFRKVQDKGAGERRMRTAQQEVIGIFWGYDGPAELGTPPRLYMQVILAVLDEIEAKSPGVLALDDELKIIAATALAMADAGIDAWKYKYSADHMMWRPVLGIPHGLTGLVPGEPGWLPLGRPNTNGSGIHFTPNFPAYPSGHATFGAAAFHLLRMYLVDKGLASFDPDGRDNVKFCCASDEYNGRNRDPREPRSPRPNMLINYDSLWDAITDNSISRVYLGVHWQFDGITIQGLDADGEFGVPDKPKDLGRRGGVWLGCQIAKDMAEKIGISAGTIADSQI